MAHCINIKHPEYIELLEKSGLKREILNAKISIWQEKNGLDKFPSVEELTYIGNRDNIDYNTGEITSTSEQKQQAQQFSTTVKEGVSELFESNPELANAVYSAIGVKNKSSTIASTIFELEPGITKEKLRTIYDNYVALMNRQREGKAVPYNTFESLLNSYQVYKYKDTYIFGNYDTKTATFITRMNSSPSSKELLAEAIPNLVKKGLDFISFVPKDYADKLVRSGYTASVSSFNYNFKGEEMDKFAVASNPNVFNKIFNKSHNNVTSEEIEDYNHSQNLRYTPVEIDAELIEKAGKDASKIFETYLKQFGIVIKDINEIKDKLGIDEIGFADILSKIAYVKDKKDLPPIAGEFIAYMMQYNPLVKDIITELSQTDKYKNLDKSQYFKIIGELISQDLQNKIKRNYNQSLIDKIKELINKFFDLFKSVPIDKINTNIGVISNNILQQNKKLITVSLYKPGAFGKPIQQVNIEDALKKDKFGASIIYNLSKQGFILTGSTALSEQGVVLRPDENPLHDIDWVSPFTREETKEKFLKFYPNAIKVRDIYGKDYITDSYLIAPEGYSISNYKADNFNGKIIINSYDVVDSKGNVVGTYRLQKQESNNQSKEVVAGIEGKVIDFFSYENYSSKNTNKPFNYKSKEGTIIQLANWKDVFKAKLNFARYKDIWDYNRFTPNENIQTPEQQKQQAQQLYAQYLEQNPNGSVEGFKNWVDGNRSNVQYQKQIDLQAEQDEVLEEFANSLSERFNISFDLISEEEAKSISPEYANEPAFFDPKTKKAYLVKGKANKTSAIHEIFTHPFLLQIEKTNSTLYKNLLKEAKNNKSVVEYVDNLYGTNRNNDHEYIARAIDLAVQGELDQQKDKTLLERIQDFFNQLYDYLKKLFNIPEVFSSAISPNITLQQLAQFAMYGKGRMDLNPAQENIEYSLKATSVIVKNLDKIKRWEKNKSISEDVLWNKIQGLGVPKEQLELVKNSEGDTVEEKLLDFANQYSYTVEINTAKHDIEDYDMVDMTEEGDFQPVQFIPDTELKIIEDEDGNPIRVEEVLSEKGKKQIEERESRRKPTQHYSNLTVPGGTNYTENEISTPLITPSIKGHAQFSTDNGIGWFRSDEQIISEKDKQAQIEGDKELQEAIEQGYAEPGMRLLSLNKGEGSKTRRILELQSDLFQKGRDKNNLINASINNKKFVEDSKLINILNNIQDKNNPFNTQVKYEGKNYDREGLNGNWYVVGEIKQTQYDLQNQFLQLLNKNNNWVTFFIKSIIQDSAKKGYEKVLFPKGETAAKIEGHETIADEIKSINDRINELSQQQSVDAYSIISAGSIFQPSTQYNDSYNEELRKKKEQYKDKYIVVDRSIGEGGRVYGVNLPQTLEGITLYDSEEEAKKEAKRRGSYNDNKIKELEQRKSELKSQGIEKLKPIEAFYEIKVGNILEKTFGKDNVKTVTDEFGNQWREITINQARDLANILLQRNEGNQEAVITPNDNQELLYKLNDIFEDRTSLIFNINNNKDFDTNSRLKAIRSLIDNKEVNYNNHLEHLEEYLELFEHLPVIYNLINKYGSKQAILEVYDNDNGSGNNNLQQEFIEAVNGLKSIFRNVNKTKLNSLENWLDENIVDINKIDIQDKDDNVLYPTEQYSLDVNNEKFIKYYYELSGKKEDIITFAKRLKSTIATYKLLGYNNDKILEMLKCL